MRSYELITIVSPEVTDEDVPSTAERVNKLIENKKGSVTKVQRWGKRKLAYPIKHHVEGHYLLTHFELDPQLTSELESELQVSEDIIRHMLIRLEDQEPEPQEDAGKPITAQPVEDAEGKGVS